MKSKRTRVDNGNTNKIPQSIVQAVFYLFWPLNNWLKKIAVVVVIVLVASFTIWAALPEKAKTKVMDFLKRSEKVQSPVVVSPAKEPLVNIQKDIRQHTEGDQSPAVISNGDVNINIGNKDSKK